MNRGVRKFICNRCEKSSNDQYATGENGLPIERLMEDGTKIQYENIDLCKKCFWKTKKEVDQTEVIKLALEQGRIKEEDLPKLQTDTKFKIDFFRNEVEAKKGDLKKKKQDLIKKLRMKSEQKYEEDQINKTEDDRF